MCLSDNKFGRMSSSGSTSVRSQLLLTYAEGGFEQFVFDVSYCPRPKLIPCLLELTTGSNKRATGSFSVSCHHKNQAPGYIVYLFDPGQVI